jgi:hypothetical protein
MRQQWSFIGALALRGTPDLGETLKRLALFCDEIRLLVPTVPVIGQTVFENPKRVQRGPDGSVMIKDFNYHQDVTHLHLVLSSALERLGDEDRDIAEALIDEEIVSECTDRAVPQDQWAVLKDLRGFLISCDVDDPEFNGISGTNPSDYSKNNLSHEITIKLRDVVECSNDELRFLCFKEPKTVADSYDLTTNLIVSEICGFQPVFPEPRHRRELHHKYARYRKGAEIFRQHAGSQVEVGPHRSQFGETAYLLSNALFSSPILARKSVKEIIRYRSAMCDARTRFVSTTLCELTQIIQGNPWGPSVKNEVEAFVEKKLMPDMVRYEDESKEIWEKLFGGLTVNLASLAGSASMGSAGGGLLGSVIPGTTAWEMLALGALAGVSKEVPKIVENLVKLALEFRKHKRSSIAYVAEFR